MLKKRHLKHKNRANSIQARNVNVEVLHLSFLPYLFSKLEFVVPSLRHLKIMKFFRKGSQCSWKNIPENILNSPPLKALL